MTHTCHATGCDLTVPPKMFMCKAHWFSLPKPMRDAIWATYRPGQENDKRPSDEYLHNARTAIAWIEQRDAEQPRITDGVSIPALTVWQPWASLIAIGAKPLEFRGHRAPPSYHGRRIAIHAGARPVSKSEVRDLCLTLHSSFWRDSGLIRAPALALLERALMAPSLLPRSAIVCTAVLGVPIRNGDVERALGLPVVSDSDRLEHTSWGWPLTDVMPAEPPIPARGAQGFWKVQVPRAVAAWEDTSSPETSSKRI